MVMPTASYRLQLTPEFGFADAAEQLAMLVRLGVSHLYLSPITEAISGSQHGYDVVDHTQVRSEFGGLTGLMELFDAADAHGLGVLIDHVPNHVSVARPDLNAVWWQVLAEGPTSPAAAHFDIQWEAADGKVLIPQMGSPIDEMLGHGQIDMRRTASGAEFVIGSLRYPLRAGTEDLDRAEAIEQQHYRLQWWRDPARNVRRFFTIDELAAVRVENLVVAEHVDTLPRVLRDHPAFAGVRVDHVDGLADPGAYLDQLRHLMGDRMVLVEKIVAAGELLPAAWPVEGTTGYEHVTTTEHVLLDPVAEAPLQELWAQLGGDATFSELERSARREVLDVGLRPDLDRLIRSVPDVRPATREAIIELTLGLDRYRTYLPDPESDPILEDLVERTQAHVSDPALLGEIERVASLLGEASEVRTRWQQLSGPVMAKGAEDRAFYRYFPLASLCEVGGAPGDWSTPIEAFHEAQMARSVRSPRSMLASTTHDTKRSAGVRARSLALAAHAREWVRTYTTWASDHADELDGIDPRFVSLAAQTGVTARPLTTDRLGDYLIKAAREGDEITSWTEQDEQSEMGLRRLAALVVQSGARGMLADFADVIEPLGDAIGLRMLAVQLTSPGFADLYQGAPMTLLGLVDPDNRVPPSWERLRQLVDDVGSIDTDPAELAGSADSARTSMTERVLRLRHRRPEAFGSSSGYQPIVADGPAAEHVVAYARTSDGQPTVVVIVTRARATPIDEATAVDLPAGSWRSLLHDDRLVTGGTTRLTELLSSAEVAVLERIEP